MEAAEASLAASQATRPLALLRYSQVDTQPGAGQEPWKYATYSEGLHAVPSGAAPPEPPELPPSEAPTHPSPCSSDAGHRAPMSPPPLESPQVPQHSPPVAALTRAVLDQAEGAEDPVQVLTQVSSPQNERGCWGLSLLTGNFPTTLESCTSVQLNPTLGGLPMISSYLT